MTTVTRIDPVEKSDVGPDDVLTFIIPEGVYDMATLKVWFNMSIPVGTQNNRLPPRDVETLIERLELYAGTQKLQHINHYNQIMRIYEDYGKSASEHNNRITYANPAYIRDAMNANIYNVDAQPWCMMKWLGLLGCEQVVDTRSLGPLRVVMTLAPANAVVVNSTTPTYSLSNVHMVLTTVSPESRRYVPASTIEYADFQSVMQYNNSLQQRTQMDVHCKQLDCAIATLLPADYRTLYRGSATNNVGSSYYFTHGTGASQQADNYDWNFSVNGTRLIQRNPTCHQAAEYLDDVIPGALMVAVHQARNGVTGHLSIANIAGALWAAGARIDRDASDGVNLCFNTHTTSHMTPIMSLLIAKMTRVLTMGGGSWRLE